NDRSPPDDSFHGYFTTISLTCAEPILRLGLSAWCRTERAVAPARRPFELDSGPQARRALHHSAGTAADWRRFFFNAFAARAGHDDPDCALAPSLEEVVKHRRLHRRNGRRDLIIKAAEVPAKSQNPRWVRDGTHSKADNGVARRAGDVGATVVARSRSRLTSRRTSAAASPSPAR